MHLSRDIYVKLDIKFKRLIVVVNLYEISWRYNTKQCYKIWSCNFLIWIHPIFQKVFEGETSFLYSHSKLIIKKRKEKKIFVQKLYIKTFSKIGQIIYKKLVTSNFMKKHKTGVRMNFFLYLFLVFKSSFTLSLVFLYHQLL